MKKPVNNIGAWATALNKAMPPLAKAVAGVIYHLRRRQKLSQNKLAELSGVSRQMISCIERHKSVPTISTVGRIALALKIPYDRLNAMAVRWLARQPACCRTCQYICITHDRIIWLNRQRECIRPPNWKPQD